MSDANTLLDQKEYVIKSFTFNKGPGFPDGVHSKNHIFKYRDHATGTEKETSVFDYFRNRYNVTLNYWMLPLIETSRGGHFPMECAILLPNQKYQYKLSPDQTSNMIKFAVTRPKQRVQAIEHGVSMLKWAQDPYLKHYGVQIETTMTEVSINLQPDSQFTNSLLRLLLDYLHPPKSSTLVPRPILVHLAVGISVARSSCKLTQSLSSLGVFASLSAVFQRQMFNVSSRCSFRLIKAMVERLRTRPLLSMSSSHLINCLRLSLPLVHLLVTKASSKSTSSAPYNHTNMYFSSEHASNPPLYSSWP